MFENSSRSYHKPMILSVTELLLGNQSKILHLSFAAGQSKNWPLGIQYSVSCSIPLAEIPGNPLINRISGAGHKRHPARKRRNGAPVAIMRTYRSLRGSSLSPNM